MKVYACKIAGKMALLENVNDFMKHFPISFKHEIYKDVDNAMYPHKHTTVVQHDGTVCDHVWNGNRMSDTQVAVEYYNNYFLSAFPDLGVYKLKKVKDTKLDIRSV